MGCSQSRVRQLYGIEKKPHKINYYSMEVIDDIYDYHEVVLIIMNDERYINNQSMNESCYLNHVQCSAVITKSVLSKFLTIDTP